MFHDQTARILLTSWMGWIRSLHRPNPGTRVLKALKGQAESIAFTTCGNTVNVRLQDPLISFPSYRPEQYPTPIIT